MKNARYRMPVISPLHDVEVPKHLDLYKEHGVGVITITRANSRVLYMAKLKAKSPPTAAQLRKRRDLMEPFAAEQECPDCQGRCCTARSKSLTSLCRLQSHPAQYVSGIPSAAILLSISHPIRCSTRCLANVRARISGPMIAL